MAMADMPRNLQPIQTRFPATGIPAFMSKEQQFSMSMKMNIGER